MTGKHWLLVYYTVLLMSLEAWWMVCNVWVAHADPTPVQCKDPESLRQLLSLRLLDPRLRHPIHRQPIARTLSHDFPCSRARWYGAAPSIEPDWTVANYVLHAKTIALPAMPFGQESGPLSGPDCAHLGTASTHLVWMTTNAKPKGSTPTIPRSSRR